MTLAMLGGTPVRTRPFTEWPEYGAEEEGALRSVLRSGEWGGYHPAVKEFERAFAEAHEVPHAVSCANGTVALEAALGALGIGPGDEVIVPPITFIATASAVLLCGGAPVFADIDPGTLNLSPRAAEAAITPRTRAILPVHFGGHPAEMDAFQDIARRRNLKLLEDAAHAHGALWRGKHVGAWGDAGTFSFQGFKVMTAGEGGMIVTRSAEIAEFCWSYCNQGRRQGGGWFEHVRLGTNCRMTGFQAAVLKAQLARFPRQTERRAENVAYFRERLRDFPGLSLVAEDARAERNPHYLVILRYRAEHFAGVARDRALQALEAEGIPAKGAYSRPIYAAPLFRKESGLLARITSTRPDWRPPQDYINLSLPEAERICRDGMWLPHQVFLGGHEDVDDIVRAVEKLHRHAAELAESKTPPGAPAGQAARGSK